MISYVIFCRIGRAFPHAHGDDPQREGAAAFNEWLKGKITATEYNTRNKNAFNKMLIALHNDLLAGQSQYGYSYTLEDKNG